MPNHVTTHLIADDRVLSIADITLDEPTWDGKTVGFDFNKIIPQPEGIETSGCTGRHGPGVVCWYEWNTDNWGTKWGAYSVDREPGIVKFETAWSHPTPVVKRLSEMFPEEEIRVLYADEDHGYNLGGYTIVNGEVTEKAEIQFGSDEANEFASQVLYGMTYSEVKKNIYGEEEDDE